MNDDHRLVRGPGAGRWILIAILILLGIGLYFKFAPRIHPVAPPVSPEVQ
jgi:hypothetical protein